LFVSFFSDPTGKVRVVKRAGSSRQKKKIIRKVVDKSTPAASSRDERSDEDVTANDKQPLEDSRDVHAGLCSVYSGVVSVSPESDQHESVVGGTACPDESSAVSQHSETDITGNDVQTESFVGGNYAARAGELVWRDQRW